jgi:hypothetical protein
MKVKVTPTGHVSIVASPDEAAALAGRPTCGADPGRLRDEIAAEVWKATTRDGRQWSERERRGCRPRRPLLSEQFGWEGAYGPEPPRRMSRAECIDERDPETRLRRLGELLEELHEDAEDAREDDDDETGSLA